MTDEEAQEVTRPDPEPAGKRLHGVFIECAAFDQAQRPAHDGRRAKPRGRARCSLRAATQARPEPRGLRSRGAAEKAHVRALRVARRADRTAVDACRRDRYEELPVEARIAADARAIERLGVESADELHGATIRAAL